MKKPNIFILLICILSLNFYGKAFSANGQGQTEIKINVPSRTLSLYKNSYLIGEYSVGVGYSQKMMTPQGYYKVEKKVIEPIWEHPYKPEGAVRISNSKNPLGQRWIGFFEDKNMVYGIHGTNDPTSIGKFVSHGCVRMNNTDVEELFDLVDIGDTVHVTYNRFKLSQEADSIMLEVFPDPYKIKSLNENEIVNEVLQTAPNIEINYGVLKQALSESNENNMYEVGKIARQPQYSVLPYSQPAPNSFSNNNYYSNYTLPANSTIQFQQMPIIYQPNSY